MNDWERLKITENNVMQLLIDYVQWKYGEEGILNLHDECTSELDFFGDDLYLVYKQILFWLTFERRDPHTGKLEIEEFVEKFVSDNDLARRLLDMTKNITQDDFLVLGNKDDILFLENSQKKFHVKIPKKKVPQFKPGRFVKARIYPWGRWEKGDLYHFASLILHRKSQEEVMREKGLITPDQMMEWYEKNFKQKAESIVISGRSSTLQSILNKLPPDWINAICVHLGIKKTGKKGEKVKRITSVLLVPSRLQSIIGALPKESFEVFKFVKQNGGTMRYNDLVKRFDGDDFGLWWEKNPPKTPIGILRIHGLLMVGKIPKGERLFKTAMIPKEIMEKMDG